MGDHLHWTLPPIYQGAIVDARPPCIGMTVLVDIALGSFLVLEPKYHILALCFLANFDLPCK